MDSDDPRRPAAGTADRGDRGGRRCRHRDPGLRGAAAEPARAERPVAIVSVPAPQGRTAPNAGTLATRCPIDSATTVAHPRPTRAPPGAAAWRADPDGEAVILRCGLERPDRVRRRQPSSGRRRGSCSRWFEAGAARSDRRRSQHLVRGGPSGVRRADAAAGSGPTPIQEISRTIAKTLPAKAVDPAPVR